MQIGVLDQVTAVDALPPVPNTALDKNTARNGLRSAGQGRQIPPSDS